MIFGTCQPLGIAHSSPEWLGGGVHGSGPPEVAKGYFEVQTDFRGASTSLGLARGF